MIAGRYFFEISPGKILLMEGPWSASTSDTEWEIAIMPFKPVQGVSPSFLNARRVSFVGREELPRLANGNIPSNLVWRQSDRAVFQKSFRELQALIQQGLATKGVPWGFQTAHFPKAQRLWQELLARTPQISPGLTLYGAELASEAVLGASPEWLFRIEEGGQTLTTVALAGTRWPGQVRDETQEKKDAREHQLVVEDIVRRLRPFGDVTTGERSWRSAGLVEHLHTPITLHSSLKLDVSELVAALHPTPAVGVFPRTAAALKWQDDLPGHEVRADFAAPWIVRHRGDGRAWALVALRQVRLRENEIFIPAGCGVIADSVEEVEWKEIQEKIHSVKLAWGLVDSKAP